MTVEAMASTGASFHETVDWAGIDWQTVKRTVRRLQVRIVKAMQQTSPCPKRGI